MNKKLVKENMSSHLITIGWNEKMESAYKRMQSKRVRHLPVINDAGEVVGMLSDRDVQRSMISEIERPSGRIVSDETIEFDVDSKVRDYMSWPAKEVDQHTELRFVAEQMVVEKVSSLLVCNGNKTVGIVTAEDLIKVLIELLSDPKTPIRWTLEHILDGTFNQLKSTLV
jgi:acetoin utilization protein AcuB